MTAFDAADLLIPKAGHRTLKSLKEAYLKELLRETLLIAAQNRSWNLTPPLYELLAGAVKQDPKVLIEILSSPEIAPTVWCARRKRDFPGFEERIEEALAALPGSLLLPLSARGLLPESGVLWELGPALASSARACQSISKSGVMLRPVPNSLLAHSLGFSLTLREGTGWRFENGRVSVAGDSPNQGSVNLNSETLLGRRPTAAGISSELCYVTLKPPRLIKLALKDLNPIASVEAHPDKAGNALNLGGHSEEDWRASLAQCLDWILELWPELFEEMEIALRQIVPVGYSDTKHLSASYKEAVGTVYMTLHPHLLTMTEALIHEFQHNKMNLASYFDGFLENAFFPLYPSPVRPDPRPLWGVLLAVHAFLPVAEFYRKMRAASHPVSQTPDFEKRLAEIDDKNREGMETLRAHARWTPAGRALMGELEKMEARHSQPGA